MRFTDDRQEHWHVRITMQGYAKLRDQDIDVCDVGTLEKMINDPGLQWDAIWTVVGKQAEKLNVDEQEFDARTFPVWMEARAALFESIIKFNQATGNEAIAIGIEKALAHRDLATKSVLEQMSQDDGETVQDQLQQASDALDAE